MKIAISSKGTDLEAQIDPQFGRCQYFIIVDSATEAFEVVDNKAAALSGSAGIQAAQTVVNAGADAVARGSLGPNSTNASMATGLKVYLGASGTVRESLEQLGRGRLQDASKPVRDDDPVDPLNYPASVFFSSLQTPARKAPRPFP
jgi:predicted Fe-Mo cluster-binding NifX family protein